MENYTRKAQKNNPEVLLCVSREPRYRKEISLLQYITQDLNSLTYKDVCSYDDEDCTVDLTDICEYYQLPQIREDSFDPTLFFSGDLEFEQQADACEDNTTAGLPTGTVAVVTSAVGISVAALIATKECALMYRPIRYML